jgi:hypothetical protein
VILNGVVVLLLSAAIAYGIVLHRKLTALQSAQSELAALLGRLDGAIVQASSTVSALKSNAAQLEMPRPGASVLVDRLARETPAPAEVAGCAPTARRRKATASLAASGRVAATKELLSAMRAVRSTG